MKKVMLDILNIMLQLIIGIAYGNRSYGSIYIIYLVFIRYKTFLH